MKKILFSSLMGLLVIIVVAAVGVGFFIGPIIKLGMEQVGPAIIQTPIKVTSVDVLLWAGRISIKGLVVGNPSGYKTPHAISVGEVSVEVQPFSVLSKKIIVSSVHVISPEITFEGGLGRSNLNKLMDNVNAKKPAVETNQAAPKIEIDDFLISKAKVHVTFTGLSQKQGTLPLPDIHLTNLGKANEGMTPAELTSAILKAVLKDTLEAVGSSVKTLGKDLGVMGKDTGRGVSQGVHEMVNGLSGLFK
ncbi:MAG: AsmA family protein [Candidatus Omnitrophica bacterium]|nr:AsmA family protein [Candidatus Omnitrophota bacterium]